jgi:hypothetical protein
MLAYHTSFNSIAGEGAVSAEDGERFGEGLGDQETVERVAVVLGERFELKDVLVTDGSGARMPTLGAKTRRRWGTQIISIGLDMGRPPTKVRVLHSWMGHRLSSAPACSQALSKSGSRAARMPTHAMRPHEWGTRCLGSFLCMGHPPRAIR